jgi:hypothetical protein
MRAAAVLVFAGLAAGSADEPRERALALLSRMNITGKIALLHGYNSPSYTGLMAANPRLGIPALTLNDGRQGFRPNDRVNTQTAFPCELATVATFDVELMRAFGEALGEEFAGKGANVVLAPMLILARVPQGGRNFESIGEDPELAYAMGAAHVAGVQSVPGVLGNADDFVLNNQETDRGDISSVCDERTLFELYYRGYKGAIDAGVASVMCSSVPGPRKKKPHFCVPTDTGPLALSGTTASTGRTRARTMSRSATSSTSSGSTAGCSAIGEAFIRRPRLPLRASTRRCPAATFLAPRSPRPSRRAPSPRPRLTTRCCASSRPCLQTASLTSRRRAPRTRT